jgi:3'-phosphoadenosine 5'-phosphosulfate sulfotransferase (PAPS reductase)/FAD synthetase
VKKEQMHDPFKIDGPTSISFSGGRTSAYMLWRVLQSNGGLPADAVVCFANTGKEEEATLEFVRDCAERWNVPITWLEYRDDVQGFAVVDFDTASRNGEPFEALIQKRNFLPNPVTRFCTSELKIRTMHKFLRARGWCTEDCPADTMTGIRADEPRRVAKIRARGTTSESRWSFMVMPLADAGVIVQDVHAFWQAQPFNLGLSTFNGRTLAGNCDLCFLKPAAQVLSLVSEKPQRAVWWAKMERYAEEHFVTRNAGGSWRFRSDRPSYAAMMNTAANQGDLYGHEDEEALACFCGE